VVTRLISTLCIRDGFAYGWALDPGSPRCEVHLWIDGRQVATEYTGVDLPAWCEAQCGQPPEAQAGFVFALAAAALDGFPHDIHAALPTGRGESLHGEVQTYEHCEVRGEVRQQGRQYVGTVWFKHAPRRVRHLEIAGPSGRVLLRQRLQVAGTPDKHGYPAKFAVPCAALPAGNLHFSCGGQALRGSPCSRHANVLGIVEEIGAAGIRGWAFDSAEVGRPIELCLRVDARPMAWFRPNTRRAEIESRLGQDNVGLIGFHVPLPDGIADGRPHRIEVVAADDGQPLKGGHQTLTLQPLWIEAGRTGAGVQPIAARLPTIASTRHAPPPLVSVVVLTRNGKAPLAAFLESWERHNHSLAAEIIVIDHASTDDTLEMLEGWSDRLDLQVIGLDHNDSFSASCNLGAARAKGEYLLFMNNDIVWLQDALPAMVDTLQEEDVGIVGLKLLKAVGESDHALQPATEVQHLGIRFKANGAGYWPYEAAPSAVRNELEHAGQVVPAVTGAVLLCRKADFELAGGFDPRYFYGFEDVELCLRLSQQLRKKVVSRNDLCALHRHGHTRLSGRELTLYDRVQSNAEVLQSQLGLWLKQAYWRSLVRGDGYMTMEALTIGLVIDSPVGERSPLTRAALALASQLQVEFPRARVVLLPPERDWKNAGGLHVLVVGSPLYDIRALHGARADLLTLAWVRSDPAAWRSLPWWDAFGGYLAPARLRTADDAVRVLPPTGAGIARLLGGRWRLRVAIQVPVPAEELTQELPVVQQARALLAALKQAGLPAWLEGMDQQDAARPMADVRVVLQADRTRHAWNARSDELNVMWLCTPGARRPPEWKPAHARVVRQQPAARWLEHAMAKVIGETFTAAP
jgi:GT2 family glycosyltransferase